MEHSKKQTETISIVGLCGSLRNSSYTSLVVQTALDGAKEMNVETKLIRLQEYNLVFCDGNEDEAKYPPGVFELRKIVKAAKGIILGTPEYHGGYSGVLKNAMDLMGFDEFEGKVIGLIGVSGGALGAVEA